MKKQGSKKKRRKLKVFLLSALVIVLVIAGYLLYEFKFKTYDVADDEVDELLDEGYTLTLPEGTTVQVGADGQVLNESVSGQFKVENEETYLLIENNRVVKVMNANGEEIEHNVLKPNLTVEKSDDQINVFIDNDNKVTVIPSQPDETPSEQKPSEQKPSVASIKEKYAPSFKALQSQAEAKIGSLVNRAKAEYSSKKANGESISFGYFYNKYMAAASEMEASTDVAFESLMAIVEKDLENNGYDKSYAVSFRNEYEASKESLRSDLYNKVMGRK